MARIHYVAHAQPRYKTVPVIDPDTGTQKVIATTRQTRRTGRQVLMRATQADRSQPLPPETCEACRQPIRPRSAIYPGDAYRWVKPKSGPYGGRRRVRHARCGTWQVWDLSDSLSAQLSRVSHEFGLALDSAESADDVQSALDEAASSVREIAEAKREAAQNIEDGFQHATSQSEELAQQADDLDAWADEIESASVPDFPEPEETDCGPCGGTGGPTAGQSCLECGGTGRVTPDEPAEDQVDAWRDECRDELSVVDESPV